MSKLQGWLRQPTTIAGLAALGAFLTAVAHGASIHDQLPVLIAAITGIVIPDHTAPK